MQWYWWVLIGIGVILLGYIKIKVFKGWMDKRTNDEDE